MSLTRLIAIAIAIAIAIVIAIAKVPYKSEVFINLNNISRYNSFWLTSEVLL